MTHEHAHLCSIQETYRIKTAVIAASAYKITCGYGNTNPDGLPVVNASFKVDFWTGWRALRRWVILWTRGILVSGSQPKIFHRTKRACDWPRSFLGEELRQTVLNPHKKVQERQEGYYRLVIINHSAVFVLWLENPSIWSSNERRDVNSSARTVPYCQSRRTRNAKFVMVMAEDIGI